MSGGIGGIFSSNAYAAKLTDKLTDKLAEKQPAETPAADDSVGWTSIFVPGAFTQQLVQKNQAERENFAALVKSFHANNVSPLLPAANPALLPEGMTGEDLSLYVTSMITESQDALGKLSVDQILANKSKMAKVNAERLEALKTEQDNQPGWFGELISKVLDWLAPIGSAICGVVAMVAGVMMSMTGLGAVAGVPLALLGAYMLAGPVVDGINAFRDEPLTWTPTLGQLVKVIASGLGASEETQQWIKMGVDLVANIAAAIAIAFLMPGPGTLIALSKLSKMIDGVKTVVDVSEKAQKLVALTQKVNAGLNIVNAATGSAKAINDGKNAFYEYEAATARAEGVELVAKLQRLQTEFSTLKDEIEKVASNISAAVKTCADMVAGSIQTTAAIVIA